MLELLRKQHHLEKNEYITLLKELEKNQELRSKLREEAVAVRNSIYGKKVYVRGLIECTNICKNDCYYCGIRKSNSNVQRYRLTKEQIIECCKTGYELGFRTFVLQGGEDGTFTDEWLYEVIEWIRKHYEDCAITLSLGERSYESYKKLKEAGANRYLLRHETANFLQYTKLHPSNMSLTNRKQCLYWLKELGYQVGAGFMVGSPYQTKETLAEDLMFLQELKPHMVGIGPFIPHHETPFAEFEAGDLELTLDLLAIIRLILPNVLLPATTALGTLSSDGRELGLSVGCNVVMPNLSPIDVRKLYELYNNKICMGEEAAKCLVCLQRRIESIGMELCMERGDYISTDENKSSLYE